jgi:hypothetical protein
MRKYVVTIASASAFATAIVSVAAQGLLPPESAAPYAQVQQPPPPQPEPPRPEPPQPPEPAPPQPTEPEPEPEPQPEPPQPEPPQPPAPEPTPEPVLAPQAEQVPPPVRTERRYVPFGGRFFASVSGAFQAGSSDFDWASSFALYEEQAQVQGRQETGSGALLDVGAGYRLGEHFGMEQLGVGAAYTRGTRSGDGALTGSLPHPLVFSRPRSFTAQGGDLSRTEQAVHLQAIWWVPFTDQVDFAVSAGPSFFSVRQDLLRSASFSEVPPLFDSVAIDEVDVGRSKAPAVGFNVGVDMTYRFTRSLGAGVLVRYTRATVDFDVTQENTVSVTAGGFQIGAGVRYRF